MSTPVTPPNPFAMPMGDLATAAGIPPAPAAPVAPAAPAVEPIAAPAAPVQPEWGQMAKGEDGIYQVTLATGEVFKGTADEVIQKQAEAHVQTKRWGQEWKQKADAVQPAQPLAQPQPVDPAVAATRKWIKDEYEAGEAAEMGIPVEEYRYRKQMALQSGPETYQGNQVTQFLKLCPDFVDSPENNQAMLQYFDGHKSFPSAIELKSAWANLKYDNKVKGMQPVAPTPAAARPVPMPASGGQPTSGEANPWNMNMEELGRLAGVTS